MREREREREGAARTSDRTHGLRSACRHKTSARANARPLSRQERDRARKAFRSLAEAIRFFKGATFSCQTDTERQTAAARSQPSIIGDDADNLVSSPSASPSLERAAREERSTAPEGKCYRLEGRTSFCLSFALSLSLSSSALTPF